MGPKKLHLHTSNRMENLAATLVEVFQDQPLPNTLSQETVMTINPGVARWLRFEIARRTGVSFGWDFPLPGKLYAKLLQGIEPEFEECGKFEESKATWLLNDILSKLEDKPRFDLVRSYCSSGASNRRFAFAARLARLYDE
ncbi:MAG: exodeoxyribonuclease V subunit gamma, partial [Verrucomicrobiota bacterium]